MIAFWLVMLAVLLAASFIWLSSLNESLYRRLVAIENHAVSEAHLSQALNENASRCVAGSEQRVRALASALGYEWKRTEAKEGWERKNPFGVGGMFSHYKALDSYLNHIRPVGMYREYNRKCAAALDAECADRRKTDRRKADVTHTANVQGAGGKVRKVSNKKPKRATH